MQLTGIDCGCLITCNPRDPGRRVYSHDGNIVKLTLLEYQTSSDCREQSLRGEFLILQRCNDISNIPKAIRWDRDKTYEMLVMTRVDTDHVTNLHPVAYLFSLYHLGNTLFKMALRGVSHNDLTSDNILIFGDGKICLIDFDQATISSIPRAFVRSFLGLKLGDSGISIGLTQYLKNQLKAILPVRLVNFIRCVLRKPPENQLPLLANDANHTAKELRKAWEIAQTSDASSPGAVLAYYSLTYEEYNFPGERPWECRWDTLRLITDYAGKRVLELGCNMSLLSCYLQLHGGSEATLAVDIDAEIIESAKHVSSAFNVSPGYLQVDFDSETNWEADLAAFSPDIVFALNVLNWVKDKSRLLDFLGRFDQVIFEGHESFAVEKDRFEKIGFKNVELITLTERSRPLMYCVK